ncbi:MAG TPA: glutamyl-tRNA reductase [Candidatus Binataceae bacterium]
MEQTLFIVGVNHRTAAVSVRERLAFAEDEFVLALRRLKERAPAVAECALLSTCNRVEFVAVAPDPIRAAGEIVQFVGADRRVEPSAFGDALYRFEGREAARHLFRVAASLDSMVVGEPQILGQVKLAYAQAAEAGTVGLVLHRAFHKAFSVAKRVRRATLIGHGSVSVSSAAVALANQIFDTLSDKTVMLMGAGKMAELTARQLKTIGIESLLITSRTFDRAVALARELGGTAVPFESYKPYLRIADVVIGSVAATRPILGPDDFDPVMRERRYRAMFLIDLGVPRNFDERLNALENVYLYDIDDLGKAVEQSLGEREHEAEKAEEIVELEIEAFSRWMAGLDLVPTIKDIRYSIERLREAELGRQRGWLSALDPAERARVELLTRSLTNKLLHRILAGLRKGGGGSPDAAYAAEIARRLLVGEFAVGDELDDELLLDDELNGIDGDLDEGDDDGEAER